jgi:hypothetical protein
VAASLNVSLAPWPIYLVAHNTITAIHPADGAFFWLITCAYATTPESPTARSHLGHGQYALDEPYDSLRRQALSWCELLASLMTMPGDPAHPRERPYSLASPGCPAWASSLASGGQQSASQCYLPRWSTKGPSRVAAGVGRRPPPSPPPPPCWRRRPPHPPPPPPCPSRHPPAREHAKISIIRRTQLLRQDPAYVVISTT